MSADIIVVGSGSLAREVVNALSQIPSASIRITIIGRSLPKVLRLTLIANARAAMFRTSVAFEPFEIPHLTALSSSQTIRRLKPKVIFHAASIQSPWESAQGENAWTKLLDAAGFGITLPLQLALATEVSRGAADSDASIINASYPDCVNPVLHRLGLRTTCGIGNSATVGALCRSHSKLRNGDVRVVGHHGHLRVWLKDKQVRAQPRIWLKGREIDSRSLRPNLAPIGKELNYVTASTAVSVIMCSLTGGTLRVSIPGVGGLPGGYPFVVRRRKFTMRLPPGVTPEEAIAHNKGGERLDGLDLGAGVTFVGKARQSLASARFEYAQGFDLAEWPSACERMVALRNRLRAIT